MPTDPYSHTPAGRGARQPGMTGQVKEEILTRLGELGLRVEGGSVAFRPSLLRPSEWTDAAQLLTYHDVAGQRQTLALPPGSLAFTFCQVPVVYTRDAGATAVEATAHLADGTSMACPGGVVDPVLSSTIFRRYGTVTRLAVRVPAR